MGRFAGAVFDLDGLLIESERLWEKAQMAAFAELGLELTLEMQHSTTGMRLQEAMGVWQGFFPRATLNASRLNASMNAYMIREFGKTGAVKPGAVRALDLCVDAGCRLAVASSSPPEVIAAALETLALAGRFHAVVSAVLEIHGKPHPAVFLSAAARLGADPGGCIAFEDSVAGVRAAKAAGMFCVAVPETHNRGRPEYAIADRIFDSLESFSPDILAG
ncbi:MAG: HAD-IA family hydrolase [Fibrobacteres bacterium]|jgi:beta-phosphoglucomutase-like phosphatase (HAD superfamily)|nr:HAD-IA family hydrolase [Fibrobacterota bacterium]